MKLTPSRRIYALGMVLLVALTICSHHFSDRGGPAFMASLTVAGVAYLFAVRELFAAEELARKVVVIALVLSAVWHVEFLRLPAGIDDDIHRYIWDGRLQRLGYNPYIVIPSDPTAKQLHTVETRSLNNPELPSPYPPGAQLFFRLVSAIHESTLAFKVAFVLCDWAIVFLLLDLLRLKGKGVHLVLAYAWNPLLPIEVAGSGHIDIVGTLFLVASAVALARRWRTAAALGLGLAIAVKFLPIVLLPLYWKRVRIRDAVLAAAVAGLLYVPFLNQGRIPTGSIGAYVQGFRFNGPVFATLVHAVSPRLLVGLAILAGLVVAAWFRSSAWSDATEAFAWPMAASLLFAPVVFPWYLLWLLPFLTSASAWLIIVWTVSIIPTYVEWHLRKVAGKWGALPAWVMLLEYASLTIAAIAILLRNSQRTARATTLSSHIE